MCKSYKKNSTEREESTYLTNLGVYQPLFANSLFALVIWILTIAELIYC